MLLKLNLYACFLIRSFVTCDKYMSKIHTRCVISNNSNSCLEYKLLTFLRKLEAHSTRTNNEVTEKKKGIQGENPDENVPGLLKLLKDGFHVTDKAEGKTFPLASQNRSLEEAPKKDLVESK